jgi:cbb3-type cytochrome oxidase subunit 3
VRLSEIVSGIADSTIYTQIAFVLFLCATAAIVYYVFTKRNSEMFDHARALPLEDDDHRAGGER